jgi:hypothetical protein
MAVVILVFATQAAALVSAQTDTIAEPRSLVGQDGRMCRVDRRPEAAALRASIDAVAGMRAVESAAIAGDDDVLFRFNRRNLSEMAHKRFGSSDNCVERHRCDSSKQ